MKHYLSIYYGIDENLPDDIFYREIKLINLQFEEKERMKKLWQSNLFQKT